MSRNSSRPPGYSSSRSSFIRPRHITEHLFSLYSRPNVPWATLKLKSTAVSSKYLPSYFDGSPISGSFELFLSSVETIHAISLTFTGELVATGRSPYKFWESSSVLWSLDMGDPRSPMTSGQVKHNGKLKGNYHWDIYFVMPATCSISLKPKSTPTDIALPPSFSERGATQYINYKINVRIHRGTLRVDNILGTIFGFCPRKRPPPFSILRQVAYSENSRLIGPEGDPEGWRIFSPIQIKGTLFNSRPTAATCMLAIAKPLSYTRGYAIPCTIIISSQDREAVDLLSSPSTPKFQLVRRIDYGSQPLPIKGSHLPSIHHTTTEISSAVWWPFPESASNHDHYSRRLDGEIHLPKDLQPSFVFAQFSLQYTVVLRCFDAVAYESSDHSPLISENVEVVTAHASGPVPRMYAPPSYDNVQREPAPYGTLTQFNL